MARPAAVLSILVEANTGKATSSLRHFDSSLQHSSSTATKAMRTHDALNKSTHRLGSSLVNAAKYAAGAAIAYIGIAQARDAVTTTEDLAKNTLILHKNLGLTIQSASEFLSVANAWGVDSKKVGMSMKTLATQVTAAKTGTASAQKSFETFGISMKELRKLSPEQLLMRTSEGMKNAKGSTDKLTAASKLFGRGWQSLNPILGEGAKKLREQLGWARQYGATLDGHAIKSLEQLREAQIKSNLAMQGMQILFTEKIAPSLIKVGLAIANFINQIRTGKGAGAKFAEVMKSVGEVLVVFYRIVRRVVIIVEGMVNVIKKVVEWFQKLPGPIKTAGAIFLWITTGPITATVIAFKTVINIIKKTINAFGWIKDAAKNTFNAISGFVSGIPGTIKSALNAVIGFINDIIDVLDKIPFVDIGHVGSIGGGGGKKHQISPKNAKALHHQKGGVIVPGQGSGDKVPAMLEPGEVVLNRKAVAVMGGPRRADAINKVVPRFQGGGQVQHLILGGVGQAISDAAGTVGDIAGKGAGFFTGMLPQPNLPSWLGHLGGGLITGATQFIKEKVGLADTKMFGSFTGIGGALSAGQFIQIARQALGLTGHKGQRGGARKLLSLAMAESSLNPRAWNKTDINAQMGNPSQGLMQVTQSNFRAFHERGTSGNIFDPLANIAASINYQFSRYGGLVTHSPYARGGVVGFQRGGVAGGDEPGPRRRKLGALGRGGGSAIGNTAPRSLNRLMAVANKVNAAHFPYKWGGGHENPANFEPFDCSGVTSYLLQQSGFPIATDVAAGFMNKFHSGAGKDFTIYASPSHVYSVIGGRGFGTSTGNDTGWFSGGARPGFVARHPDLAAAGGGAASTAAKAPKPKPKHLGPASLKKLKALKAKLGALGLYPHIQGAIDTATTLAAQFDEYAGYAEQGPDGSWKGVPESRYLLQELAQLFILRNKLIAAFELLSANRDRLANTIGGWQRELKTLQAVQNPTTAQKQRKALLRASIKTGLASQTDLNSKIGAVTGSSGLQAVQGSGGPMGKMASLTPSAAVGTFGGSIFDVANRLLGLGANTAVTDTSTGASSDLLRQLLQEANQRFLVSQAQYKVFGAFAGGGVASRRGMYLVGERGPELATLAPGQRVYSNQQSQAMGSNVEVHFWEGERRAAVKVNGEFVDARIERHNRKAGRRSARALPGARQVGP